MNKKKILSLLEFLLLLTIFTLIHNNIFIPLMLKLDNSFFQSNVVKFITWIIVGTIMGVIYELLLKPLVKKMYTK